MRLRQANIAEQREFASEVRTRIAKNEQVLQNFKGQLSKPLEDKCPTCGQELPEETLKSLQQERMNTEILRDGVGGELDRDNKLVENIEKKAEELSMMEPAEKPIGPLAVEWDERAYNDVQARLQHVNIDSAREMVQRADGAAVGIKEVDILTEALAKEIGLIHEAIDEIDVAFDDQADTDHDAASRRRETVQGEYDNAQHNYTMLAGKVQALEANIKTLEEKALAIEALIDQVELDALVADMWRTLETACSQNGIQALEIDALAPGISTVANDLLNDSYGSRYRIEIRTTRIGGSGSKQKQIEDFRILVHDAETGIEQELETLSGGETVWIRKAIYDAFSAIRANNSGMQFLTVFLDEADGALDASNRDFYFSMVQAAHDRFCRVNTLIITHALDAQDRIEKQIVMKELV